MLRADSLHRRLPILISPAGNFFTPTTPLGYNTGHATGEVLSGQRKYTFQALEIREGSWWRRSKWRAKCAAFVFDYFPGGWKILEGRPLKLPKSLTPEEAKQRKV